MPTQTFIFADISGFTALTEAHGDDAAADLVAAFRDAVQPKLGNREAEEVKTIGDALMIRAEDAAEAIKLGLEIVHEVGGHHGFPTVRVGMHTGSATERGGDWFGAGVNLAARVAGQAAGGEVLLTDATRAEVGADHNFVLSQRGRVWLRNISEPVFLFGALRRGVVSTGELPVDPVCRMSVEPESAVGSLQHRGRVHFFCSLDCAGRFAAEPQRYGAELGPG